MLILLWDGWFSSWILSKSVFQLGENQILWVNVYTKISHRWDLKNRQGKQALRSFVSFWAGCLPLLSPDPLASPCSSYSVPPETDPCGPPQRLLGPLASGSGSSGEHGKEEGSEVWELVSGTPSGGVTDLSAQLWPPATHGCSPPPINLNCHCLGSCTVPVVSLGPTCTLQSPFHWTCLKLP